MKRESQRLLDAAMHTRLDNPDVYEIARSFDRGVCLAVADDGLWLTEATFPR